MESEDSWPESHILESKNELNFSMENFKVYIDNIMKERSWKKICAFDINSDIYSKCRIVSTKYSTYSRLIHLIYQIPQNKQGFILVKLEGRDGDHIYGKTFKNKFRMKIEVIFYYKQEGTIDRILNEPKYWNYMGGYNMEVVREAYRPKVDLGFNVTNLDKLEYTMLLQTFENITDNLPDGPFQTMRLYTLIPDRYEWPDIEILYWNTIGASISKLIMNGTGILNKLTDDMTLAQYLEKSKHTICFRT